MDGIKPIIDHLGRHGCYATEHNKLSRPVFRADDLHEDLFVYRYATLASKGEKLILDLDIHEQGYGGISTWLTGPLAGTDAFEISFPEDCPDDFRFGLGYIDHPNERYSNHIHTVVDYCLEDDSQAAIRTATVAPEKDRPSAPCPIIRNVPRADKERRLGFAIMDRRVFFYLYRRGDTTPFHFQIDLTSRDQPLRIFFDVYIEENRRFVMENQTPLEWAG